MTPEERFERLRTQFPGRRQPVPDVWFRAASLCEDQAVAVLVLTAHEAHATWELTPGEAIEHVVTLIKKYKRRVPEGALRQALTAMREVGLVNTLIPGGQSLDAWFDATDEERDAEMDWIQQKLERGTPRKREAAERFKDIRRNPISADTLNAALAMPDEWWTRPVPGEPSPP